jgi:hypothetical protein
MAVQPVLKLDKSRAFGTVHGDRQVDDPLYRVRYYQGGFPFDTDGILVPDDGQRGLKEGMDQDGRKVFYPPLYSEPLRVLLNKKLERLLKSSKAQIEPEDDEEIVDAEDFSEEDVNLEAWLRGDVKYPPHQIYKACRKRYSKNHTSIRSVVNDLVLDEELIPENEVAPELARLLDQKAA